jgi:hypothetical protein
MGPQITHRPAWQTLASLPSYKKALDSANKSLAEPIPDQPDSLYLLYSQTGDRDGWQSVAFDRRRRFMHLVLAECITNDGRYLPKIAEYVAALCAENTWVYPAHDGNLRNFQKQTVDIDLGASTLGLNLATAHWLLADKLDPASRKLIEENIRTRLTAPFRDRYSGKVPPNNFMTNTSNWNAVCLAGTVGAILATEPDRHTRAEAAAAGEFYSQNYLKGFPADGYCTEGLGYWNYGFGRYIMLSEILRTATQSKLDLLTRPHARLAAQFPTRIELLHGISPAFADCAITAKPEPAILSFVNHYYGMGLPNLAPAAPFADPNGTVTDLAFEMVYRFTDAKPLPRSTAQPAAPGPRLRDYFDATGILIARPAPDSPAKLAVALKGGNNGEHHNHNDLGSYVVLAGGEGGVDRPILLDPGPEHYTARTFSDKRYDSKLLNSFGHDVPLVAGQLQRTGKEAQAKVLKADFTPEQDTFSLDLTSAYNVPELHSLTRTWTYSRKGAGGRGELTVTDEVAFSSPQNFGTALVTLGKWSTLFNGQLQLEDGPGGGQAVLITLTTSAPFNLNPETLNENAPIKPTRLGINLKEKATTAKITLTIAPR